MVTPKEISQIKEALLQSIQHKVQCPCPYGLGDARCPKQQVIDLVKNG